MSRTKLGKKGTASQRAQAHALRHGGQRRPHNHGRRKTGTSTGASVGGGAG